MLLRAAHATLPTAAHARPAHAPAAHAPATHAPAPHAAREAGQRRHPRLLLAAHPHLSSAAHTHAASTIGAALASHGPSHAVRAAEIHAEIRGAADASTCHHTTAARQVATGPAGAAHAAGAAHVAGAARATHAGGLARLHAEADAVAVEVGGHRATHEGGVDLNRRAQDEHLASLEGRRRRGGA